MLSISRACAFRHLGRRAAEGARRHRHSGRLSVANSAAAVDAATTATTATTAAAAAAAAAVPGSQDQLGRCLELRSLNPRRVMGSGSR
jgi:uncharacterized protein (DUF2147 family)